MKKAFTITELLVAVGVMALALSATGVIFRVSIDAHRTAGATAEIMRNLRAITDQLNTDFKGLQKDGYLILCSDELDKYEFYDSADPCSFGADRLYYFCTGDFQTWNRNEDTRSNIARIYFGHGHSTFVDDSVPVSDWSLARDVVLLTPGQSLGPDCYDVSYAQCKVDLQGSLEDPNWLLANGMQIDIESDPNTVRSLMCQNVGQIIIEWTDGTKNGAELRWYGYGYQKRSDDFEYAEKIGESVSPPYMAYWTPGNRQYWPKALKFTLTLYDSKSILKEGKTFTHIVYLGD